jgi:hypothetical protein
MHAAASCLVRNHQVAVTLMHAWARLVSKRNTTYLPLRVFLFLLSPLKQKLAALDSPDFVTKQISQKKSCSPDKCLQLLFQAHLQILPRTYQNRSEHVGLI